MKFEPFLALSASAGSGKTYALVLRYLSLLFLDESPSSILAATFTKKAANEMRQRVIANLRGLENDEGLLGAIAEQTALSKEAIVKKRKSVLARFLKSNTYIVTLDSFFASILRSASLQIGIEPGFKISRNIPKRFEQIFLQEAHKEGAMSRLAQFLIESEKRYGDGLEILHHLYLNEPLLNPKLAKNESVSLEAIEDRIETLREQIYALLQKAGVSQTALRNFEPNSAKKLSEKTVFDKESLHEHRNYKKYIERYPKIEAYFQEIKTALAQWMLAKEQNVLAVVFELLEIYKRSRMSVIRQENELSFDDITVLTYRLLHNAIIDTAFLYFKLDSKFRHILLDEFQDTSTLQYLILKPLIEEIIAGAGQHEQKLRSFFYVGDTKQSIYRFRGGVEALFTKVRQWHDIVVCPMEYNYRSSEAIVTFVNEVFQNRMQGYVPQIPVRTAKGYVKVAQASEDEVYHTAADEAERFIAKGVDADHIAILTKTNKEAQTIQKILRQKGIDSLLKSSNEIQKLPHIAALTGALSYLYERNRIDILPFLQKIGAKEEAFKTDWFYPTMSPFAVLHRLIEAYGYYHDDPNILKLLEFAQSYSDIPTFLEEFERGSIPTADKSLSGVTVMTIHSSKGLEFEYVVVCDKAGRGKSDTDALLFGYDEALHIEHIRLRQKNKERFDPKYASSKQELKVLAQHDLQNTLYVALTRAKKGLTVVKKEQGGIFESLGLEPMEKGVIEPSVTVQKTTKATKSYTPRYFGAQEIIDPTDKEQIDAQTARFGTALHYALEMIDFEKEKSIHDAMTAVQNRFGTQLSVAEYAQIAKRLEHLIENGAFRDLIKDARLHKERSVAYGGEIKRIDLLLEYPDRFTVVDYKSSKTAQAQHIAQVRGYMRAIASVTRKPVGGAIVYLTEEDIEVIILKNT